jgi:hypothetical protein
MVQILEFYRRDRHVPTPPRERAKEGPMGKLTLTAIALLVLAGAGSTAFAQAPSDRPASSQGISTQCKETPGGKAVKFVCAYPPFLAEENADDDSEASDSGVRIVLKLPEGTPLRIAIDQRARISHVGEPVQGHVVATVYAFDEAVIPAGTIATGRVTYIAPVSKLRRLESYADGDFSPFHRYEVTFDLLTLPDGRQLSIETTVAPGATHVVHLLSKPQNVDQDNDDDNATAQNAEDEKPSKLHRLKEFLVGQSPYRRQYLEVGTRFSAALNQELDFGSETQSEDQLSQLGQLPLANSILHARLLLEVSSATATRGTPVVAEITQPVYSADHQLLLPSGSRLIGQVVEARAARHLHRNGELRVIFEHIEMPGGNLQEVQGTLEGIEVDRAAHMKLDEEGGARATDPKTRYLSTGVAIAMAAVAAHPDVIRGSGTVDEADDPAVRAGAGASGFGLAGTLIGLAAKSNAVSIVFSAYGASASIYSNFLSRGREVVLPKNAPLEIGLGTSHSGGVKH